MKLSHHASKTISQISVLIILMLLAVSVYLYLNCESQKEELARANADLRQAELNQRMVDFGQLFVEKVLKADQEVSFEVRLELENQVRRLGNKEVLDSWNRFVASQNEDEARNEVKNLLSLIMASLSPTK